MWSNLRRVLTSAWPHHAIASFTLTTAATVALCAGCSSPAPRQPLTATAIGQWIWTRADLARFTESQQADTAIQAGIYIGAVTCDERTHTLISRSGLSVGVVSVPVVTAVIRFEDGLERCRAAAPPADFSRALDSAVRVLRTRATGRRIAAIQLDYDAPQRALAAWATNVRALRAGALAGDSVWVTSILAHLREPGYGDLFRTVVSGHVLQVFDTGEEATSDQVAQALRLARRARMPFRMGFGAFERQTRRGPTNHRAWFGTLRAFAAVDGYRGVWVFPAGRRWISIFREHG